MPDEVKIQTLTSMLEDDPVKAIQAMIKSSENALSERQSTWDRYWRKYRRGLKYQPTSDTTQTPLFFVNYIFTVVETSRVYLTRSLPSIVATPVEISDDMAAEIATTILRHEMTRARVLDAAKRVLQHAFITGVGWFKAYYDKEAGNHGKGAIVIDVVPPEDILIDPLATSQHDARWIIHRKRNVPYEDVMDLLDGKDLPAGTETPLRPSGEVHDTPGAVVTRYEAWVREKNGWHVYQLVENVLVKDFKSPYTRHNKTPFVPLFDMVDDRADNFYKIGIGEIEEIEAQQDKIDALDWLIYANIRNTVNRQRLVDVSKGISPDQVDNTPGRVYGVMGDPRSAMIWDQPASLSQDVFAYRFQAEQYIQSVSGIFEVTQGKRPTGIVAARAIERLQEAAATRLYDKQLSLCSALRDVAELCLYNIFQFYDSDRIVRTANNHLLRITGKYPDELSIPKDASDEEKMAIEMQRIQWKEQSGYNIVLEDIDLDYDIEVDAESSLPSSKRDRAQQAGELFRLKAIDRRALLEAADWPNRNEILARMGDGSIADTEAQQAGAEQLIQAIIQQMLQQGQQIMPENQIMPELY